MIRIWLYNDPSCCQLLSSESELFAQRSPDLFVEISKGKSFEYFYNMEAPQDFVGICGMMSEGSSPLDYAVRPSGADFPIVFSPGGNPSVRTIGSSLRKLKESSEGPASVDVFIDMSLFEEIKAWLGGIGSIGILYDLGVSPENELLDLVHTLSLSGRLEEDSWSGLYCDGSPELQLGSESAKVTEKDFMDMLNSIPKGVYLA